MNTWTGGGGRAATAREIAEAREVREMAANQLPILRRSAANWRNAVGFGNVLALAVSVLATPDVVAALEDQERFNVGWLLGIGAGLGTASLGLAMYASFGWVTRPRIGTTGGLRKWRERSVTLGVISLGASMVLALGALTALVCAASVAIFGVPWAWDFPGW